MLEKRATTVEAELYLFKISFDKHWKQQHKLQAQIIFLLLEYDIVNHVNGSDRKWTNVLIRYLQA